MLLATDATIPAGSAGLLVTAVGVVLVLAWLRSLYR